MRIVYAPTALKQLKKIGVKDLPKVRRKIQMLELNPLAGKQLGGQLGGEYSLRAGPLRIIYLFYPKQQLIQIEVVDYRGSVYKK